MLPIIHLIKETKPILGRCFNFNKDGVINYMKFHLNFIMNMLLFDTYFPLWNFRSIRCSSSAVQWLCEDVSGTEGTYNTAGGWSEKSECPLCNVQRWCWGKTCCLFSSRECVLFLQRHKNFSPETTRHSPHLIIFVSYYMVNWTKFDCIAGYKKFSFWKKMRGKSGLLDIWWIVYRVSRHRVVN